MNGVNFIETLKKLRYPNVGKLKADDYDWMFECGPASAFMKWFCGYLNKENILEPTQRQLYEHLRKSGGVILEGYDLGEALLNQTKFSGTMDNYEDDDEDISKMDSEKIEDYLKKQINNVEKKIKDEMLEKKFLEKEETVLKKMLYKNENSVKILEKSTKNTKMSQETCNKIVSSEIEKVSSSINDLVTHIKKSISYYDFESLDNKRLFFFQTNFNTFLLADEEITNIIKESYETFIEGTDVENFKNTLHHNTMNEFTDDSSMEYKLKKDLKVELALLEIFLYKTDLNYIKQASEDIGKEEKSCYIINENASGNELDTKGLKNEISQINSKISSKELIEKTKISSIDSLIKEKAQLEVELIAASNYEEIISNQNKIIEQFDNIIHKLESQTCFRSTLKGFLWVELERIVSFHAILIYLSEHIGINVTSLSAQNFKFAELQEKIMQLKSSKVLNNNIAYLHDLNNIVSLGLPPSKESSNITYDNLKEKLLVLQQNKTKSQASKIEKDFHLSKNAKNLSKELKNAMSEHFRAVLHQISDPNLLQNIDSDVEYKFLPKQIVELLEEFCELVKKMEEGVREVLKDVDSKMSILKHNEISAIEHKLPLYFYTDPDKLKKCIKKIEDKTKTVDFN